MGKFFGTDGVRGEANRVLTADLAYRLGRAAAHVPHLWRYAGGQLNCRNLFGRGRCL